MSPKSSVTKRKRSPSSSQQAQSPHKIPRLEPEQMNDLYKRAFNMYFVYLTHFNHIYNPTTGLLETSDYYIHPGKQPKEMQETLARLSRRIAIQVVHIFDGLRSDILQINQDINGWGHTKIRAMLPPDTHIDDHDDRFELARLIVKREYESIRDALNNFELFAKAYLYYYLVNYSDYTRFNIAGNSRGFLFQMNCALHKNAENCGPDIINRHTQYPVHRTTFDEDHDQLERILLMFMQHTKQIADINRRTKSDTEHSVGVQRRETPESGGKRRSRTRNKRKIR